MKRTIITFSVILVSFVSCKHNEAKEVQTTGQNLLGESNSVYEIKDSALVNSTQFFQNDSLRMQLYLDLEKLIDNFTFTVDKKPINNRHVDNLVDTIITFKADNIEIITYKAMSEEFIYKAVIGNPEAKFSGSIKVGMKKQAFEKILKKELNSDLIIVGNLEQTSEFIFQFESDTLSEIKFDGYLD